MEHTIEAPAEGPLAVRQQRRHLQIPIVDGEDRALPVDLPRYLKETLNSPEQVRSVPSTPYRALRLSR